MKRKRFTESQIAFALRQVDEGVTIGETCRKMGISEPTFYRWRNKYGGLMPSEMKKLKQLAETLGSKLRFSGFYTLALILLPPQTVINLSQEVGYNGTSVENPVRRCSVPYLKQG